jgi:glyoxylase-like metal-dependent hydrolase (beta-lactamase superfamily II)
MPDSCHQISKISVDTYRISEDGIVNAYLLLGEKKALLIDCGLGIGNIRQCVEEITSLPIDVALTHLHCDHAGGRNWFDHYAYHKKDNIGILYFLSSSLAAKQLLKMEGKSEKLSKKNKHPKRLLFDDTCVFDLGGRLIRVMNTPGHTPGSTVYLDEKEHFLFTGDEVEPWLWLQLPGCLSVEKWLPNAKKILSLCNDYTVYSGHYKDALPKAAIQELVARGEELVKGTKGIKVSRGVYAYPDNRWQEHAVIWYRKAK